MAGEGADLREARDIELLLQWAYQDQVVHKAGVEGEWVYLDQAALAERGRFGGAYQSKSSDGCFAVERYATLGTFVDGGGLHASDARDHDAEVLHDAVSRLPNGRRFLVFNHALAGTRPEWGEGVVPRLEPIFKRNRWPWWDAEGKPKRGSYETMYQAGRKEVVYVPLRPKPELSQLMTKRIGYSLWWDALATLTEALGRSDAGMRRFRPTGPSAPAYPWETDATAQRLDYLATEKRAAKS